MMDTDSNRLLDAGQHYIKPVDAKDLKISNPDDYITQLNLLISPSERLKKLLISTINITTEPTYEAMWVRKFMLLGASTGFFAGALFNSKDIHQDYIRQHNASVFDNKYVGNRHFWDTLAYRCAGRGFKLAFRVGTLTTVSALIGISSITYRNKLYLPDWIIGYTTLGALSRLWVGPRAMAAGGVIYLGASMIVYGAFRLSEIMTGVSLSQFEYIHHKQWLSERQSKLHRNHLMKEEMLMEYMQRAMEHDSPR